MMRSARRLIEQARREPRRRPAISLMVAVLLVSLSLAACSSTATYPIDFFSEMHYQKSWHAQEPPRPNAPSTLVPITGDAVPDYTFEEAADLTNPIPETPESQQRGAELFAVNCVVCHGPEGNGDGTVSGYFNAANVPAPADLRRDDIRALTDGQLFWVITNGFGEYMPPFGNLITPEQRWAVVIHIRDLQER
jgi:hypothetical protein